MKGGNGEFNPFLDIRSFYFHVGNFSRVEFVCVVRNCPTGKWKIIKKKKNELRYLQVVKLVGKPNKKTKKEFEMEFFCGLLSNIPNPFTTAQTIKVLWKSNIVLLFAAIRSYYFYLRNVLSLVRREKLWKTMSDFRNCADSRLQVLPFTRFSSAAATTAATRILRAAHYAVKREQKIGTKGEKKRETGRWLGKMFL